MGFVLKMPCIQGDRALRGIWTIRFKSPHLMARGSAEKMIRIFSRIFSRLRRSVVTTEKAKNNNTIFHRFVLIYYHHRDFDFMSQSIYGSAEDEVFKSAMTMGAHHQ